jgi:hypothetical protein
MKNRLNLEFSEWEFSLIKCLLLFPAIRHFYYRYQEQLVSKSIIIKTNYKNLSFSFKSLAFQKFHVSTYSKILLISAYSDRKVIFGNRIGIPSHYLVYNILYSDVSLVGYTPHVASTKRRRSLRRRPPGSRRCCFAFPKPLRAD